MISVLNYLEENNLITISDIHLEGIPCAHLSLALSQFKHFQHISLKSFNKILNQYFISFSRENYITALGKHADKVNNIKVEEDQIDESAFSSKVISSYVDRLGRNILQLLIQNNFTDGLISFLKFSTKHISEADGVVSNNNSLESFNQKEKLITSTGTGTTDSNPIENSNFSSPTLTMTEFLFKEIDSILNQINYSFGELHITKVLIPTCSIIKFITSQLNYYSELMVSKDFDDKSSFDYINDYRYSEVIDLVTSEITDSILNLIKRNISELSQSNGSVIVNENNNNYTNLDSNYNNTNNNINSNINTFKNNFPVEQEYKLEELIKAYSSLILLNNNTALNAIAKNCLTQNNFYLLFFVLKSITDNLIKSETLISNYPVWLFKSYLDFINKINTISNQVYENEISTNPLISDNHKNNCKIVVKSISNLTNLNLIDNSNEDINNIKAFDKNNKDNKDNHNLNKLKLELNNSLNQISKLVSQDKTLIVTDPIFIEHTKLLYKNATERVRMRQERMENSDRLKSLLNKDFGVFNNNNFSKNSKLITCSNKAELADITRVHNFNYINSIKEKCKFLITNKQGLNSVRFDQDSDINARTFDAAFTAAQCGITAAEKVINGEFKNAFVACRPPGHHAAYFGRTEKNMEDSKTSHGFCFVNNIAVAAAYIRYKYKYRIAIVDFDVHHGNGTEELVRNLNEKNKITFRKESLFGAYQTELNICTPWLNYDDKKEILFISLHGFDEDQPDNFYPCCGSDKENTRSSEDSIFPGGVLNIPLSSETKYSHNYRNLFTSKVVSRLHLFKPDIILISAGFDGHENELINHDYSRLTEFDYRWITKELCNVADKYCNGRVVSLLEGGYNIHSGVVSSFVQSVSYHVNELLNYNSSTVCSNEVVDENSSANNNEDNVKNRNDKDKNKEYKEYSDEYSSNSYDNKLNFLNKKRKKLYENNSMLFSKSKNIKSKLFGYKYKEDEQIKEQTTNYRLRLRVKKPLNSTNDGNDLANDENKVITVENINKRVITEIEDNNDLDLKEK